MSGGADDAPAGEASSGWERLDRAAQAAAAAVAEWRRRALDAEDEVRRLRGALEAVTEGERDAASTTGAPALLAAENALLRSRTEEARRRVDALLARLTTMEAGR